MDTTWPEKGSLYSFISTWLLFLWVNLSILSCFYRNSSFDFHPKYLQNYSSKQFCKVNSPKIIFLQCRMMHDERMGFQTFFIIRIPCASINTFAWSNMHDKQCVHCTFLWLRILFIFESSASFIYTLLLSFGNKIP